MRKLRPVAEAVALDPGICMVEPGDIDILPKLRRLHDPSYVDAFDTGKPLRLASANGWHWTAAIRDGVLAMQRGQLTAAQMALENGISANVAQGFHHARYARGSSFCTFNGLALIAQEYPDLRITVVDCDEHGGDGTEEFIDRLPNLTQVTLHGTRFGCRGSARSRLFSVTDESYLRTLAEAIIVAERFKPDLILYQAGVDCHEDDPLGATGATTETLRLRDREVFDWVTTARIPCMFVLAGGYQEPIGERLVPLHVQTFTEACRARTDRA
jgi:acetoin utilization deacetylase AcuC-like enzyme